MSTANDITDALVAHLTAMPELADIPIIADRQKDIGVVIAGKVAKGGGNCVTLLYEGFRNPDGSGSYLPNVIRRYTATVYSRPVLQDPSVMPADDLVETLALRLHHWEPDEVVPGFVQINVLGGDLRGDLKFLIYDLDIEVTSKL